MTEHLTVAVDGSAASSAAVEWVIERAGGLEVEVEILTVVPLARSSGVVAAATVRRAAGVGTSVVRRLEASGVVASWSTTVAHGPLLESILASSQHADLLVIGARPSVEPQESSPLPLRLRLAACASVPVVAVPLGWVRSRGPVIVGLDGDAIAAALSFAVGEADRCRVPLLAVQGWRISSLVVGARMQPRVRSTQPRAEAAAGGAVAQRVGDGGPAAGEEAYGHPSMLLAERVRHARLTVIGTRPGLALRGDERRVLVRLHGPVAIVPTPPASGTVPARARRRAPTGFRARGLHDRRSTSRGPGADG